MPIGTYTMLKGTKPSFGEKDTTSAFYYAYGPGSGAVKKYGKISGVITLPERVRLVGTGEGRNAYISLGLSSTNLGGVDIGLRNRGLGCDSNELKVHVKSKDSGYGWHPYCTEMDRRIDAGYYFDGLDNIHKERVVTGGMVSHNDACYAPDGTSAARFTIVPNLNGKSIHFKVEWLDGKGNMIDAASNFEREIKLEGTYQWDNFCRFASLVTPDNTATMTDRTYVVNGGFSEMKIGSANWGIYTKQVQLSWIMNEPKCKVSSATATGEKFTIDHWA